MLELVLQRKSLGLGSLRTGDSLGRKGLRLGRGREAGDFGRLPEPGRIAWTPRPRVQTTTRSKKGEEGKLGKKRRRQERKLLGLTQMGRVIFKLVDTIVGPMGAARGGLFWQGVGLKEEIEEQEEGSVQQRQEPTER